MIFNRRAAFALAALLLVPAAGRGHEFKMESVMTGFVKIDEREAHLVVRLPLHAIRSIRFPLKGAEIDLARADPALQQALATIGQDIIVYEDGRPLAPAAFRARLSLPSDRSFERYSDAVAHVAAPADTAAGIYADQGYLDADLTYPIASPRSRFGIRTMMAPELKDYLKFAVRYLPLDDAPRAMVITSRSGAVPLNPSWTQAAGGFAILGIEHILSGFDHLLFLLCLVIPLVRVRQVLAVVTAFTLAHSFTLLGSAYGLAPEGAWFPPFVETAIAASIVFMALENVVGVDTRRRWVLTGLFGLVHGFGFSYGLRENLQFAGNHLLVSLFAFNVGIELGQLAVLAALLPALALLRRTALGGRIGVIILSALVGHTGWHWMIERGEVLWKTDWPAIDGAAVTTLARWVAGALLAGAAAHLLSRRWGALVARWRNAPRPASKVESISRSSPSA